MKLVKAFPFNEVRSKEPFILVNNNDIEYNRIEVAKTFNKIFPKYCQKSWSSGIPILGEATQ